MQFAGVLCCWKTSRRKFLTMPLALDSILVGYVVPRAVYDLATIVDLLVLS
jgi:hypothetical protein